MREIKFFACTLDGIIEVESVDFEGKWATYHNIHGEKEIFDITEFPLMECTGEKDIDEREICEGHIIKCDGLLWKVEYGMSCYTKGFTLEAINHHDSCVHHEVWERGEIIGNIYENPEYLGVKVEVENEE
jgi:hypothetical protein